MKADSDQKLFENILSSHSERKVQALCKKVIKKCSFNSGSDISNLCCLAYWLYIYGYEDDTLSVCHFSDQAEFPGKAVWNVWDYIMFMRGLEVCILKKRNQTDEAETVIHEMDRIWNLPSLVSPDLSEEERKSREQKRRESFTIESCSFRDKIEASYSASMADDYRLSALFRLIGYGATGLFPNLSIHQREADALVNEYAQILKKRK